MYFTRAEARATVEHALRLTMSASIHLNVAVASAAVALQVGSSPRYGGARGRSSSGLARGRPLPPNPRCEH
jgi:hypothetical protein